VVFVLVLMLVASAGAVLTVVVVVVIVMVVFVLVLMLVASAGAVLTVVVVVVIVMVVFVLVLMLVTSAGAVLTVVVVMVMVMVRSAAFRTKLSAFQFLQIMGERRALFHGRKYLLSAERIPIGGHELCVLVMSTDKLNGSEKLFFGKSACVAEDYSVCALYLVIEKLSEVFHIHFAFLCINHRGGAVKKNALYIQVAHSTDNVGKLAHTGGLDEYSLGCVFLNNLAKSL